MNQMERENQRYIATSQAYEERTGQPPQGTGGFIGSLVASSKSRKHKVAVGKWSKALDSYLGEKKAWGETDVPLPEGIQGPLQTRAQMGIPFPGQGPPAPPTQEQARESFFQVLEQI